MSPEPSSSSSLMSPRNILIGVAVVAVIGIGGFAAANFGQAKKADSSVDSIAAKVAPPIAAEALASADAKPATSAPNVRKDYKPDSSAPSAAPAVKESEKKQLDGPADNQLASVKQQGTKTVAKTDPNPLNAVAFGSPDAPVTIIEYASLGCPHCAEFNQHYLPKLKKLYIDKGLVRMIFRPIPLPEFQGVDASAAMLVLCVQPKRREAMISRLFQQQTDWIPFGAPANEIKSRVMHSLEGYGRSAGLSKETVDKCLTNERNKAWMMAVLAESEKQGVEGTPTFFINGKSYSNMPIAEWQKTINPLLPKTN
jgi:protein-disulfide isomerase